MDEYIKREALIAHIKNLPTWWADAGGVYGRSMKYPEGMFDCEDVISSVENAPAADVAPVVHGHWIKDNDSFQTDDYYCCYFDYNCSECSNIVNDRYKLPNYCPNCGAKMDGKGGDA